MKPILLSAICLAISSGVSAQVDDAILPGWYVSLTQPHTPAQIVQDGGRAVVLYTAWYEDMTDPANVTLIRNYLNEAYECGLRVLLSVDTLVDAGDTEGLTLMVNLFRNHPAVAGWYLFDEPDSSDDGTMLAHSQSAAAIIRSRSSKPIFIVFWDKGIEDGSVANFKDTYDIVMYDKYVFGIGDPEFCGLEDIGAWKGWKRGFSEANARAQAAGRPLYSVIQSLGVQSDWAENYRLTTYREQRFMAMWSVLSGARGVIFWCDYRRITTPASPGEVYPYDGTQWLQDVAKPVMEEINTLSPATIGGPIAGGVGVNNSNISAQVYRDPQTHTYYLLAINPTGNSPTVEFTLRVTGVRFQTAIPLYGGPGPRPVSSDQRLSESFTRYGVRTYSLVALYNAGDANGDGAVDVGDLSILAANYGTTSGAAWEQGDFNADGKVDVGDLGILAAHYGTGTGATRDFTAEAMNESPMPPTLGCGSVGLPLIAGLTTFGVFLVGLMNRK